MLSRAPHEAADAFFAALDRYTSADLLRPATDLVALLDLDDAAPTAERHRPGA